MIPRAIVMALAGAVVVYAVVAVAVLSVLGPVGTAASAAPVADAVRMVGDPWAVGVVRVGAALASAGALLALVAGLGRTGLAMAREHDLPGWLDAVHPRFRVPHRAELTVAAVVVVLVLTTDLRGAIGFSSFGVLLYYFVANAAAYAQGAAGPALPALAPAARLRRLPRPRRHPSLGGGRHRPGRLRDRHRPPRGAAPRVVTLRYPRECARTPSAQEQITERYNRRPATSVG